MLRQCYHLYLASEPVRQNGGPNKGKFAVVVATKE